MNTSLPRNPAPKQHLKDFPELEGVQLDWDAQMRVNRAKRKKADDDAREELQATRQNVGRGRREQHLAEEELAKERNTSDDVELGG